MDRMYTTNVVVENKMESSTLPRYVQKNNVPPLQTTYATLPKQQVLSIPQQQYQYQSNQYLVQSPTQLTANPNFNTLYMLKPIQIVKQNPAKPIQTATHQSTAPTSAVPVSPQFSRMNGSFVEYSTPRVKSSMTRRSVDPGSKPRRSVLF